MIKFLLLCFFIFEAITLFPHQPLSKRFNYTFQQFSLTWPGHFCSDKWCDRRFTSNWNGRTFVVHGLWPASKEYGFIDMITTMDADPFCNTSQPFNLRDLPANITSTLEKVMPQLTKSDIWSHEWSKHGVCYLKILHNRLYGDSNIDASFSKRAFVKYFESICQLYERIAKRFNLTKGEYANGDELARDLKLDPATVKFIVDAGNLKEIHICVSLPKDEKTIETIQRCEIRTGYRGSIRLQGWKADRGQTSHQHIELL